MSNVEFAQKLNPGNIATWNGDLSAFRDRGGKILTYHGRSDPVCLFNCLLYDALAK
jgi:hypothetical protein